MAARVALISSKSFQELLDRVGVTEFQADAKIAGEEAGDGWENASIVRGRIAKVTEPFAW